MDKNFGVLTPILKIKDWILGGTSQIVYQEICNDWTPYLPDGESQFNLEGDFYDCVTESALHSIETQLNWALLNGKFSPQQIKDLSALNYIVNGKFSFSVRFTASQSGTTRAGNDQGTVIETIRTKGLLGAIDYPMTPVMTFDQYYAPIPQNLVNKAVKILDYIDIAYEWIITDTNPASDYVNNNLIIQKHVKQAPLQMSTPICPSYFSGHLVTSCPLVQPTHAQCIYGVDSNLNKKVFDSYAPYNKLYSVDYPIPYVMKIVATAINVEPVLPAWQQFINFLIGLFSSKSAAVAYTFTQPLMVGMTGQNVVILQDFLKTQGFFPEYQVSSGLFGQITLQAVKQFQTKNGLPSTGYWGQLSITKANSLIHMQPKTLIDALIHVESGGDDNAKGDLGLAQHAYGCLQIRQPVCDDVNRHYGTNHQSQDCLGNRAISIDICNKYFEMYPQNSSDEDKARSWNGGANWKLIYNKPGYGNYSHNIDVYWDKVSSYLNS